MNNMNDSQAVVNALLRGDDEAFRTLIAEWDHANIRQLASALFRAHCRLDNVADITLLKERAR